MRSTWVAIAAVGFLIAYGAGNVARADGHGGKDMTPEQAAMMEAWTKAMMPGEAHADLAATAGAWNATIRMWETPDSEPEISEGVLNRAMILGGRVLEERFSSTWMGVPFVGVGHRGYDNVTGTYWSTWIDNMSTAVSALKGNWDETGRRMVMEGMSSDPMAGGEVPMRIESRVEEDGREISEFFKPGPDGKMYRMMKITYRR